MKPYPLITSITKLHHIFILTLLITVSCKTPNTVLKETKPAPVQTSIKQDWQSALKSSFRKHYKASVNSHAKKMHAKYPVITQDLLNMTLIPSNGKKVRFKMNRKAYMTLAHTSHTPLAIYSILYPSDFIVNNDSTLSKLKAYRLLLEDAKKGIQEVQHINKEQQQRISSLINISAEYVQKMISTKTTSKEEYNDYARSVRPLVENNLHDGAKEQLIQFLAQLENWKLEFPNENWEELRVVVMGFHQPRDFYALKLFFQWLLNEPEVEKRVVYAEFQFSIFGKNREKAEKLALELLTKVDLEKEPSLFLLGEETLLQKDVMGPAADRILKDWGATKWFLK